MVCSLKWIAYRFQFFHKLSIFKLHVLRERCYTCYSVNQGSEVKRRNIFCKGFSTYRTLNSWIISNRLIPIYPGRSEAAATTSKDEFNRKPNCFFAKVMRKLRGASVDGDYTIPVVFGKSRCSNRTMEAPWPRRKQVPSCHSYPGC